ncbi:MAG: mechanosensitive ion channel [Oligoflexia bacterium]|nr:mechanosensitive ion channel [Oligoflexia bacterium]
MDSLNPKAWQKSLESSTQILWEKLVEYIPNVLGTLILLVAGYFISKLLAKISIKILRTVGIDKVSEKIGLHKTLEKLGVQLKSSDLFGRIFFWLIMLVFIISASEALHLNKITETIDAFVRYLPNIIGAGLIFILGLMAVQFLKNIVEDFSQKAGLEYGKILASVIHFVAVIVVGVLAVEQLQLETELIKNIMEILLISAGVVLALSLGLGTKDLSKSWVSGLSLKEQIKQGSHLEFENIKGVVKKVGAINTTVDLDDGAKAHIPNSTLITNTFKSK